ncbi:MAG: lysophospholipid acyltransferase family protein [Bdellovibrionales bacterium]
MKEWNYENEQWSKLPAHLRHLPLFTRHFDMASYCIRFLWFVFLKYVFFKFYLRIKVKGNFKEVYKKHPKLIIISNHASHLDAISISVAVPFRYWIHLYFAAAKDYFFSNFWMTFFSKHCIGAIPLDRQEKKSDAIKLCVSLLTNLSKIWMVMFPEGTRSHTGLVRDFKRGVSLFSLRSNVPILFLYVENAYELWPKGRPFAIPGTITVHVGPVHPPAGIDEINRAFRQWGSTIHPHKFVAQETSENPAT